MALAFSSALASLLNGRLHFALAGVYRPVHWAKRSPCRSPAPTSPTQSRRINVG
jgi:hypothetical protein